MIRSAYPPLYVTELPSAPFDGQDIHFNAGGGIVWHFRHNASAPAGFRWESIGAQTSLMVASGVQLDTATDNVWQSGFTLNIPLAGRWRLIYEARMFAAAANAAAEVGFSGAGLSGTQAINQAQGAAFTAQPTSTTTELVLSAGTLTERFRGPGTHAKYIHRRTLMAAPVQVG